jgi:1-acyl-sn-glycerol-3-phosphate acyltransferase
MPFIRSLLFTLVFYLGSIPLVLGAYLGSLSSRPVMYAFVRGWSSHHHLCARWILGIKVQVEGQLSTKPVLYAVKHESMFETIDLANMYGIPGVIAKQELFRIPFWGSAALRYGNIAVDREAGASALRKMIHWGKDMQAQGRPIVIFPEGTRVPPGATPPLQSGFAGLYKLLGLPVVPVAVNSGTLCPRGQFVRKSGVITYRIGEEIPPGLPREEVEARVHQAINALNA